MRIVMDTNVFIVVMGRNSEYNPIFDAFLQGRFTLLLSTAIVLEYAEILALRHTPPTLYLIQTMLENLPNISTVDIWYRWNLIYHDPDDNKFVDCAVAGQADALITSDTHFDILKTLPFPPLNVLSIREFATLLGIDLA